MKVASKIYLSNNLRRLGGIDGSDVLHHGSIEVGLLVEMITESPVNQALLRCPKTRFLSQLNSQGEHVPLVEHFKPLLQRLFVVSVNLDK